MIQYNKGNIFDATSGILTHACNGQGVWGSGIAVEFKKRFPEAYKQYHNYCINSQLANSSPCGSAVLTIPENGFQIGCLITSLGFGKFKDSKPQILHYTEYAIDDLLQRARMSNVLEIHSNKFNSGLFQVPWEETEEVLKEVLEAYPEISWSVWEV